MDNTIFRVLDAPSLSAAEQMALDKVVITAHSQGLIPNTIRFLQFKPCVLVGVHQNTGLEVNVPYCQQNGIAINRRITGGGSLYWGPWELGWSIYAHKNTPGIPRKIEDMYQLLCQAMVLGLTKIGLKAAYRPVNDIEIKGRKISGTGGTELADSFLFQCSLLIDFDVDEMLRVLRLPLEKLSDKAVKSMRDRVTCVKDELGYLPEITAIKQAILYGLKKTLGYDFSPGELTSSELNLLDEYLPFFKSDDWIYGRVDRVVNTVDCTVSFKAPGGLIRVQMRLDEAVQVIKYVIISGDFFAYPARVINDLETVLKNTPIDGTRIANIINHFFNKNEYEIPGVLPCHFVEAILRAVEKAKAEQSLAKQVSAEVKSEITA